MAHLRDTGRPLMRCSSAGRRRRLAPTVGLGEGVPMSGLTFERADASM